MELHQLRYFVCVAEEQNFSRAAKKCFVSQPSLSQQISKLEKEIGGTLFDRLPRQIKLTSAGQRLFERAKNILHSVDDAIHHAVNDEEQGVGTLIIGAIPTIAPFVLPQILAEFSRRHPRVDVVVVEDVTESLLNRCEAGELDFAIMAAPVEGDAFLVQELTTDELLLATSNNHPLAIAEQVSMDDIFSAPFILLHEEHCLGKQIVSFCTNIAEHRPVLTCTSSQLTTVCKMIALGYGVSLIPQLAAYELDTQNVHFRPLNDETRSRTIVLVSNRHRSISWAHQQAEKLAVEMTKRIASTAKKHFAKQFDHHHPK